jgi:hypothetical protein
MANDDKPRAGAKSGPSGAGRRDPGPADVSRRSRPSERPFDLWLHKQLHAMYDEIASEPLPDDLVNLIDRDASNQAGGDEKPDGAGGKKA